MIEISSSNASSSTSVTDVQSQAKDNDKTIKELTPENKDVDKILEKVEDVEKPADPEENQEEDELIGSSQESFLEDNRYDFRCIDINSYLCLVGWLVGWLVGCFYAQL